MVIIVGRSIIKIDKVMTASITKEMTEKTNDFSNKVKGLEAEKRPIELEAARTTDWEEDSKLPGIPIKGFKVIGERNSGTNYMQGLLEGAFPNYTSNYPEGPFKHMFGHSLFQESYLKARNEIATDIIWVFMVRKPCDWADGMFRKPHHICPPTKPSDCKELITGPVTGYGDLNGITREEFMNLPMYDSAELSDGEVLAYSNIFKLRAHKLRKMKQIMDLFPHRSIIVDYEVVKKAPGVFIHDLVQQFNFTVDPTFNSGGSSNRIHSAMCLNEKEWVIAQKNIDWSMEGLFGHHNLQCHQCSGKNLGY